MYKCNAPNIPFKLHKFIETTNSFLRFYTLYHILNQQFTHEPFDVAKLQNPIIQIIFQFHVNASNPGFNLYFRNFQQLMQYQSYKRLVKCFTCQL